MAVFGFILFDQFEDLDFVGPWEMIAQWSQNHQGPELVVVSEKGGLVKSVLGLSMQSQVDFKACPHLDYFLVPGGQGTRSEVNNANMVSFIKDKATHAEEILSVCTGSFLLQAAGLLRNKKATTHHLSLDRLRAFPDVTVLEERYVRDGNIWTAAGISAGIDLSLAFIANKAGESVANEIRIQTEYLGPFLNS